jgi:hypothetical protein
MKKNCTEATVNIWVLYTHYDDVFVFEDVGGDCPDWDCDRIEAFLEAQGLVVEDCQYMASAADVSRYRKQSNGTWA